MSEHPPGKLFILNVQIEPTRDVEANLAQAEALIFNARKNYAHFDLICLPEYFSLGMRKKLGQRLARQVMQQSLDALERWARLCRSYVVGGTIPEVHNNRIYDSVFLLDRRGKVLNRYRKIYLYADWGETAIFTPGSGAEVIDLGFTKLGLAVCRDLRFPSLFGGLTEKGAEIFCVPTTWNYPYETDWEVLGRCRALENQAYFVLTNITGRHPSEGAFFGRSMVVDYRGNVISMMDDRPGYQVAHIDLKPLREWRRTFRVFDFCDVEYAIDQHQSLDNVEHPEHIDSARAKLE